MHYRIEDKEDPVAKLVINADDFGLAEDINKGIIECYTQGAISDISLLAVGDWFGHAVKLANENNIGKIGGHLALTGSFKPATPRESVSSLIDRNGRFYKGYAGFFARFFTGRIDKDEIYREFKNQISIIKKAGFRITHLDSHQHIHVVPDILKIVIKLMKEEGVDYVRFPLEKLDMFTKLTDPQALYRNLALSFMCSVSKKILVPSGVKHNDYFFGHARGLRLKGEDLIFAISNLKDGLTELACHPRGEELKALCDKNFLNEIKTRSVALVSY